MSTPSRRSCPPSLHTSFSAGTEVQTEWNAQAQKKPCGRIAPVPDKVTVSCSVLELVSLKSASPMLARTAAVEGDSAGATAGT